MNLHESGQNETRVQLGRETSKVEIADQDVRNVTKQMGESAKSQGALHELLSVPKARKLAKLQPPQFEGGMRRCFGLSQAHWRPLHKTCCD